MAADPVGAIARQPAGSRRDPLRDAYRLASAAWVGLLAIGGSKLGSDALAYWRTRDAALYHLEYGTVGAFAYSPAAAQAIAPFTLLPWPLFSALWAALLLVTLAWLGGRWAVLLLLTPVVAFELHAGNIHILLGAAVVAGFRWPAAWAFVLLTKVTPGIGLLWFALRGEWRPLGIAVAVTAAVAGLSFALAPDAWLAWPDYLLRAQQPAQSTAIPVPLAVRLPTAAVLLAWGAASDRRWTVPVASMLALPVLWVGSLAMLAAVIPLAAGRKNRLGAPAAGRGAGPPPRTGPRG